MLLILTQDAEKPNGGGAGRFFAGPQQFKAESRFSARATPFKPGGKFK